MMKIRMKVMNLDDVPDSAGDTFKDVNLDFTDQVPVEYQYDGKLYGTARLQKTDDGLYAVMEIPDNFVGLTPAVGGTIHERDCGVVKKASISCVSFSPIPNADPRIVAVTEADVVE